MTDLAVTTIHGADTSLDLADVEKFRKNLRGELLRPGDEGYDAARKIHNGMIDRRPALIVRCAGTADVIAAVLFSREHEIQFSIRGGGHGTPGYAICNDGLMIDLSRMRGVRVDPKRQTARAEGGTTWGDFDHETQVFGLATTGGIARPTGIAGLTLGGGHGFLMRKYGLACDNLLSVDVVTAEGRLVTASTQENPDLFWGLRGGGGNFGVGTSFEYRLHRVGTVLGGLLIYPIGLARDLLRLYRDVTSTAPDELGALTALASLPDGTPVAAVLLSYNGPIADGERVIAPLRAFGPPLVDQVAPVPYTAVQSIAENFNPPGMRNYWKAHYLTGLSDDSIDTMVEHFATVPSPLTHIAIENFGGAVSRVGVSETAVAHRDADYDVVAIAMWPDAAQDDRNIAWVRRLWEALQPHSSGGVYVNFLDNEGEDRVRAAYDPAKYERLVALKNKYDPINLFRFNQNIRPTTVS